MSEVLAVLNNLYQLTSLKVITNFCIKEGSKMSQQLETIVTIKIPDELVLVEKARLIELEEKEYRGQFLTMKDFVARAGRCSSWIKENILMNPRLIKKLDIENGGFVYYKKSQSDRWLFKASGLVDFIENELGDYLKGIPKEEKTDERVN